MRSVFKRSLLATNGYEEAELAVRTAVELAKSPGSRAPRSACQAVTAYPTLP